MAYGYTMNDYWLTVTPKVLQFAMHAATLPAVLRLIIIIKNICARYIWLCIKYVPVTVMFEINVQVCTPWILQK